MDSRPDSIKFYRHLTFRTIYLIQYIYFEITGKEETPALLQFIGLVLIVSSWLLYYHFLASDSLKNYSPPSEPPRGYPYPG